MPKDINVKITPKPEWLRATEELEKRKVLGGESQAPDDPSKPSVRDHIDD